MKMTSSEEIVPTPLEIKEDKIIDEQQILQENNPNICEPIRSLNDLYDTLENPPLWIKDTIGLSKRCKYVIRNSTDDCHVQEVDYWPKERLDRNKTPKTLVCHDMMGGYLLDKYVKGVEEGNGFTFHRWAQTDIFCYFSHHFITIPTLPWINLAHRNGTAVIGTLITEHKDGEDLCREIFENVDSYRKLAEALVEICVIYKFEGWLVNIENPVDKPDLLLDFVKYLTEKLHEKIPQSYVIWYDSVTFDGKLDWQNELNDKNRCYFDVCDGIYLNYNWKEEEISRSCEAAKDRLLDVYVGIDIWGRGSYGGGCFNAYKAAKVIYEHNMSMAIFAPGWEHENNPQLPKEDFLKRYYSRSSLLWKLFWPYMFTTPIERCFTTLFRTGVTTEYYNLQSQDIQPSYFPSHCITTETCNIDVAKDICGCVQESIIDNSRYLLLNNEDVTENNVVHRLFATEIKLEKKVQLDIFVDTSGGNKKCDYDVVLLLADNLDNIKKVVCTVRNLSATMEDVEVVLPLKVSTNDFEEDILKHWDHRSFSLEYPQYRILEIGIKLVDGNSLNLCGFSLQYV